ncbi:MAG: efflux RND transporter permease subunit, partial [Myxococcota bacterium]
MSRIISWFVHNPVASNLFMCVLLAGGLLSWPLIHLEEFPSIDTDMIRVTVTYLGATPEEVEESVCIRIEEEVDGIEGIDRLSSLAVEGACVVTIELVTGSDASLALDEVKNRIDGINTFPLETEEPVVSRVVLRREVMQIAVSGDTDERSLKQLGRQVRDEIAALPGVSQVDLAYSRPYEISIEVPEDRLRRHGLSFDHMAQMVRRSSLDMPGGSVKTRGGEILLRTKGQAYRGEQFEDIRIMTDPDGTVVRLGEIAAIRDGFENLDLSARFNGKPTVVVEVKRVGNEDIQQIAAQVTAYLAQARLRMPAGIELSAFADKSQDLESRLDALSGNARSGLILVLLVLGLFLRFRLAMWVAAGVPIALAGALMFFPTLGLAISTLSVMAFILVLGILVDDAIVVGESVFTRERNGEPQLSAAVGGTLDVYIPVTFGVLTTVAAFLPLVMVDGRMGQFFEVIGFTAMLCLLFSLIESQLILPSHLAHRRVAASRRGEPNAFVKRWAAIQGRLTDGMETLASVNYRRSLATALEWRYVTLALALSTLVLAVSLFASGRMRYQFF